MVKIQCAILSFFVSIVCAAALSLVYAFTEPIITEAEKNSIIENLKEVMNAQQFKEIIPDSLWQALDSLNNIVGIVFQVHPQGFGGLIPVTVGLDSDAKITSIKISKEGLKETPGLGARVADLDFTKQFIGKHAAILKLKTDGGDIDAVTGATISSRAVCNGIKKGIKQYSKYIESKDNKKQLFFNAQNFVEIIKDTLWYALSGRDTLGVIFIGITFGYLDSIKFMVGMDRKSKIIGINILYSKETDGIGERIRDKEFLDKFKEGIPDAITGATISSTALINAVKRNIERFKKFLK